MPIGCFSSTHEQTDISSFTNNLYICLFELWKSKDLRPLNTGYIYDTLNIIGRDTLRGERRITKAFNVMTSNVVAASLTSLAIYSSPNDVLLRSHSNAILDSLSQDMIV